MALQKQVVPVNLGQGLDTKTDSTSVVPGKLLTLENGIFISPKSIRKRNGYQKFGSSVLNPPTAAMSTITSGQSGMAYNNELLLCDKNSIYSYDSANNGWAYKSSLVSTLVTQQQVVRNTAGQTQQDSAVHLDGLQCFAWEDTRGGVRYSIIDSNTGQLLVSDRRLATNEIKPRVVVIDNHFAIFWVNTSDWRIYGATISTAMPTVAPTPVVITAAAGNGQLKSTAPNYDAVVMDTQSGQRLYLCYNNSTPTTGGITILGSPAANPLVADKSITAVAEPGNVLTIFPDQFNMGPVLSWYNGTSVKYISFASTLASSYAGETVETIANVISITGTSTSSTSVNIELFYSCSAASTYNYFTKRAVITTFFGSVGQLMLTVPLITSPGYQVSTPTILARSVALFGKAFTYNSIAYVPVTYQSPLQSTYFILDSSAKVTAKILYGLGGGIPARTDSNGSAMLTSSNAGPDTTLWQFATLVKDLLFTTGSSGGGTLTESYTQNGVQSVGIDFFDANNSYLRAELGGVLQISGGYLQMYDGSIVVEQGFHLFPEPVTVPGPVAGHTYQYVVCYEWTDRQGRLHRSAPSPAVSLIQANPIDGSHTVAVTIPTLRLTSKTNVTCVVYRTIDLGTVFYQVSSITSPVSNSTTTDTVTFTDNVTDAVLQGSPQLYTTGGVLENIPPNSVGHLVVHRNRLMALDTTTGQWSYSKECLPGSPVEFSDLFVLNVDVRGGYSTAGASLDDKFVIFKHNSIFVVTGRGPDATGNQNDFSDAIQVTSDCGCINPRSIVSTPIGVMFKSEKGIYLLDRSLQVVYIGADVEAYNTSTITSAQLIASTNQVRFTLDSNQALVYDYFTQQWSVFTNINAVDACLFQNLYTYLSPFGSAFQETPGVFSDNGNWIRLRIKTSWLQLAGIQGFQRVYKALILGGYISPHFLRAQVAYDLNPTPVQDTYIAPVAQSSYGSDSVYGSEPSIASDTTVYGGTFVIEQYRLGLSVQKCEAIQFTIEDMPSSEPTGEGISLSAIALEVGAKKGAFKVPFTRQVGG